ncbi:MAG: VCBS repeat-containing protein [Ideonella sp.]|nr:VCBS repeat-containing protein [Ideonella sp.]
MKTLARLASVLLLAAHAASAQVNYGETLVEWSQVWGSVVADFDRDGQPDLFIEGHDANDRIWYATPTGYMPGAQVFPRSDRHACAAADVNRDGRMDIYCAIGAHQGTGVKANELWLQRRDGTFRTAKDFGAEDPYGRGRRPVFFNMNRDKLPDLYVTNYAEPRPDGQPNINRVYVNQGRQGFAEVTTLATGPNGSLCAGKGDINHDGWDDLVVCVNGAPGHLYVNTATGDFEDLALKVVGGKWKDAKLEDMNADGWHDLVLITNDNRLQVWLNTRVAPYFGRPEFEDALPNIGVSIAIGDFNLDGHKDLYVVLQDADCQTTLHDIAPDLAFMGTPAGWERRQLPQGYDGCGYLADVVSGRLILLLQGGHSWTGPSYLLTID